MKVPFPTFLYEDELWKKDYLVVGIDEVGRGAFAGPVTVGAVVFDPQMDTEKRKTVENLGIHDSKKLSSKKRQELAPQILSYALHACFSNVPIETINKIGIGKSTEMGVRNVVKEIRLRFGKRNIFLLLDAFAVNNIPTIDIQNQKPIIYGDAISLSIAAASIIAKVHRDSLMTELAKEYPHYFWEINKGYGTKTHRDALAQFGACCEHRTDFIKKHLQ